MRFGGLLAVDGVRIQRPVRWNFAIIGPNGRRQDHGVNCINGFIIRPRTNYLHSMATHRSDQLLGGSLRWRDWASHGGWRQESTTGFFGGAFRVGAGRMARTFKTCACSNMTVVENMLIAHIPRLRTGLFAGRPVQTPRLS